jgi:chromatin remodeling complex protein RSC6
MQQDPRNKKQIIPDEKMKAVFGNKSFPGFSMMKYLSKHVDVDRNS